jgi:hypothetical protein
MQLGGCADSEVLLYEVVYLALCNFMMNPTKEQRVCIIFCANLRKSASETLPMIRQVFREESISHTWVLQWHSQLRVSQISIEDKQVGPSATQCPTL